MQGSLYPDGVTVDRVALSRTELTKAAEILRNRRNWTSRGVLSGGSVVVNGAPLPTPWLTVNLNPFSGFTPNGEYIECAVPYGNIALASTTSGAVNYIGAVYTEAKTHSQPHEANQQTYPVFSEMAWRIRVYTEEDYNGLPYSDENLANDARDRFLILAKVTARGSLTSIEASDIQGPRAFNNILFSDPIDLGVITGVRVRGVSPGMSLGAGTLLYEYQASPLQYSFAWRAAGDASAGDPVVITEDGSLEVYDFVGNDYLQLEVSSALLPLGDTSEVISIYNLYAQAVPRLTGEDILHRNMQGSGIPTPENPHAMTIDDLSGQDLSLLNEHQNVMHANGINRISSDVCLSTRVNINPAGDFLEVEPPASTDLYYVNGKKLSEVIPASGVIYFDTPAEEASYYYEVYVSDSGSIEYSGSIDGIPGKAAFPVGDRQCAGTQIVGMSDNYPAGSYQLKILCTGFPGDRIWNISWGGDGIVGGLPNGDAVTLASADNSQVIRLYDAAGVNWIDLWCHTDDSVNEDGYMPVNATNADMIVVRPSLTEGNDTYMKIAGTNYWWREADGGKWVMGFDPLNSGRTTNDMRIWGNTGSEHLTTELLESMFYEPLNTQGRSGCLMRRTSRYAPFDVTDEGGGSIRVNGGIYYTRGRRVVKTAAEFFSLAPNTEYLVWADVEGVYHLKIISGVMTDEMRSILGDPYDREAVNSTFHSTNGYYAPERGVIIAHLETDGSSNPTYIEDFTQNVNQVDNPWSVGTRRMGDLQSQSAYDNLYAAMEYAKYSMYGDPVDLASRGSRVITVEGATMVGVTRPLVQPTGVTVQGCGNKDIDAGVGGSSVIIESTSVDGAWKMSPGCKIQNLYVLSEHFSGVSSIHMTHHTEISGCVFSSGNPLYKGVAAHLSHVNGCLDAKVVNNTFYGSMFIYQGSDSCEGFVISGNYVQYRNTATALSEPAHGIYLKDAVNCTVTGNVIRALDNYSNNSAAIIINNGSRISIVGNTIALNDSIQVVRSCRGVWVLDSNDIVITGNKIGWDAATFKSGVGVHLEGNTSVVEVCNNDISHMGVGIRTDGSIRVCKICSNTLNSVFGVPILLSDLASTGTTDSYSISVDDNLITNCGAGPNGTLQVPSTVAAMIWLSGDPQSSGNDIKSISVCGNNIKGSQSSGSLRAIYMNVLGGSNGYTYNVRICDNIISELTCSGSMLRGINVTGQSGVNSNSYMRYLDICDNQISMDVVGQAADTGGLNVGIRVEGHVINANLNNNNIRIIDSGSSYGMSGEGMRLGNADTAPMGQVGIKSNRIEAIGMGINLDSSQAMISDNYILVQGGKGLYIRKSTFNHQVVDNFIQNNCRFEGNYTSRHVAGCHCIALAQTGSIGDYGASGCYIKGNKLLMNAYDDGRTEDVPQCSAAIRGFELQRTVICDNYIHLQVRSIDGTPVDAYYMVWAVYLKVRQGGGQENWINVENNQFNDDEGTNNQAVVGGLCIDCYGPFGWVPESDYLYGTVKGNTFDTALTIYGGSEAFANSEQYGNGDTLERAVPGNYPYTICVSPYFAMSEFMPVGTPTGYASNFNPRAQIFFTGNHIRPNYKAIPDDLPGGSPVSEVLCKVYLPTNRPGYHSGVGGGILWALGFGGVCAWADANDNYGPWVGRIDIDARTNSDYMWSR